MRLNRLNVLIAVLTISLLSLIIYIFLFTIAKTVYVDSTRLLNGYKGMIEARKDYDQKRSVWQGNVDTLAKSVQEAIRKYSNELATGSVKEKSLSRDIIQGKQKELVDYQNAVKQDAAKEEERLNQSVFATVNAYLLRYGKKNGYKMILIAANGNIAYADQSIDVTDKVVEDLNKEYAGPAK